MQVSPATNTVVELDRSGAACESVNDDTRYRAQGKAERDWQRRDADRPMPETPTEGIRVSLPASRSPHDLTTSTKAPVCKHNRAVS